MSGPEPMWVVGRHYLILLSSGRTIAGYITSVGLHCIQVDCVAYTDTPGRYLEAIWYDQLHNADTYLNEGDNGCITIGLAVISEAVKWDGECLKQVNEPNEEP